jgi:hypothetical protein
MKMYEIYFKKYINIIYKIMNNPRPHMQKNLDLGRNMHGTLKPKVNICEL